MLRWFAGRTSDALVYNPNNGRPIGSDTGTVWADEERTTQYTELLDVNEDLVGSVLTTDAYGYPQKFAIDADPAVEVVWLDFTDGFGPMVRIECRDRATFAGVTPETLDPTAAALVEDGDSDLTSALSANYATLSELVIDAQALKAQSSRQAAYRPGQDRGLAAFAKSSGLVVSGSSYAASVGGTDGTGIIPRFSRLARASFRVKITKGTVGSKSVVGWVNTDAATMPTGTTPTFSFGYVQGTGLGFLRENVGPYAASIADASLTDGEEYDVSLQWSSVNVDGFSAVSARWAKSDGTNSGHALNLVNNTFWPIMGNLLVRTNVAAGGISQFVYSSTPTGEVTTPGYGRLTYSGVALEEVVMRVPAKPNGLAIIACHGHGGGADETGWSSAAITPTWDEAERAGYTILVPRMGGNLWGNDTVQDLLEELHGIVVDEFKLDPRVFLWGNSMGGGAALTAISQRRFPVRAARLVDPVCDLSLLWTNPGFASLPAAYGDDTAARDAHNPMVLPVESFAGVPLLFTASASDTTIPKAGHTDAMRTRLGSTVETRLITTTGTHNATDAFRAQETVNWLSSRI